MFNSRIVTPGSILALAAAVDSKALHIVGLPPRDRTAESKRVPLIAGLLSLTDALKSEIGKFEGDKKQMRADVEPSFGQVKKSFEMASKVLWTTPSSSSDYRKALSIFDLHNGHLSDDSGLIASSATARGRTDQVQRPASSGGH